jgi:hypothetical protein
MNAVTVFVVDAVLDSACGLAELYTLCFLSGKSLFSAAANYHALHLGEEAEHAR